MTMLKDLFGLTQFSAPFASRARGPEKKPG